jgi:hypothetical protein
VPTAEYMREYRKKKKDDCKVRIKAGPDGYVHFKKSNMANCLKLLTLLEKPEDFEINMALSKNQVFGIKNTNIFTLVEE